MMRLCKAEVKPIFSEERMLFHEILVHSGILDELPKKTCFYNIMGDVIVDGNKIIRVTFDQKAMSWRATKTREYKTDLNGTDLRKAIEANRHILQEKERVSLEFIDETLKRYRAVTPAVSFSGGKDSAAVLWLVRQVMKDIDVIFLNTTIEFDETVSYIRTLMSAWECRYVETLPPREFFDLCDELGPPSCYMKWCCKTQKFAPLNRLINERYPQGILTFSGIRKRESNIRKDFQNIQRNDAIPKQLLAFPINDWSSLDIWLYTFWKEIPYNKLYDYGFARVGCWACPEKSLGNLKLAQRIHPEYFDKLHSVLLSYAKKHSYDDDWVYTGKWRFRSTKFMKSAACTSQLCASDNEIVYSIEKPELMTRVGEFLKVFGKVSKNSVMTKIVGPGIDITIISNRLRTRVEDAKMLVAFEKQLAKAMNCVGCGACVGSCPNGTLKLVDGEIAVGATCASCLRCIQANGLRMGCVSLNYRHEVLSVAH